jgi:hypothetical protein
MGQSNTYITHTEQTTGDFDRVCFINTIAVAKARGSNGKGKKRDPSVLY